MRVLIVNTSEKTGGAAVAANRLMEALNNNGGESQDARRRQANRRNQRSATIKQVGCEVAFPVGAAHGVSPSAFPQGTSL